MIFVSRSSRWKWWELASESYHSISLVPCVPGPEVQSTSLGAAACVTQMHVLQHVASLNYHLCKHLLRAMRPTIIKCNQIMCLLAATSASSRGSQHLLEQSCCLVRIGIHRERRNVKCSCLTMTGTQPEGAAGSACQPLLWLTMINSSVSSV